jgi:hypothetical protein
MSSAGFEPAVPASERPQTHAYLVQPESEKVKKNFH